MYQALPALPYCKRRKAGRGTGNEAMDLHIGMEYLASFPGLLTPVFVTGVRRPGNEAMEYYHPVLCTLYSAPCTLHPVLCTLYSAPCTLHPRTSTRQPQSATLSPTLQVPALTHQGRVYMCVLPHSVLFPHCSLYSHARYIRHPRLVRRVHVVCLRI